MTFEQGVTNINRQFMDMLAEAENWFGERDKNWTYTGIEFREDGPYINYYRNKTISIVLSEDSSRNFQQLYYQLAHETCHLLYPTGKADANKLNEGISTYFSRIYQEKIFPNSTYAIDSINQSAYKRAYELVEKLIEKDKHVIKNLRQINPCISNITKADLEKLNLDLSDEFMEELIEKF